jgi:antibiotic biosynthesis monooxygenase (ABM) superfamily enzyme
MIILNETIILDPEVHNEWLNWLKTVHIPTVMASGYFSSHHILKVLNSPNEGFTYCVQYHTDSLDNYHRYEQSIATQLKNTHLKKFENKLVLFESIMEFVD